MNVPIQKVHKYCLNLMILNLLMSRTSQKEIVSGNLVGTHPLWARCNNFTKTLLEHIYFQIWLCFINSEITIKLSKGQGSKTWSNVGQADYYFIITDVKDGKVVYGTGTIKN